jgi:hypothetical protein
MGLFSAPQGKGGGSKSAKSAKSDVVKWSAKLAKNDAKHGRGSKSNPNNKPNGWN